MFLVHVKERTIIPPQQVSEATRVIEMDHDTIRVPPPTTHKALPSFSVTSAHTLVFCQTSYLNEKKNTFYNKKLLLKPMKIIFQHHEYRSDFVLEFNLFMHIDSACICK